MTGGEAPCPPPVTSPAPSHWSGHGPGGHTGDDTDTLTSGRTWCLLCRKELDDCNQRLLSWFKQSMKIQQKGM